MNGICAALKISAILRASGGILVESTRSPSFAFALIHKPNIPGFMLLNKQLTSLFQLCFVSNVTKSFIYVREFVFSEHHTFTLNLSFSGTRSNSLPILNLSQSVMCQKVCPPNICF